MSKLSMCFYLVSERQCGCVLGSVHVDDIKLVPGTEVIGKADERGGPSLGDTVVDHYKTVKVQNTAWPAKLTQRLLPVAHSSCRKNSVMHLPSLSFVSQVKDKHTPREEHEKRKYNSSSCKGNTRSQGGTGTIMLGPCFHEKVMITTLTLTLREVQVERKFSCK